MIRMMLCQTEGEFRSVTKLESLRSDAGLTDD